MAAPLRVLVVDDQEIFLRSVEALLETTDELELVGRAWNGELALELVEQLSPDVVLMDIDMPVMDGVEATRQLAARFPDAQVFILSGLHEPERIAAALAAGAVSYAAKESIGMELIGALTQFGRRRGSYG